MRSREGGDHAVGVWLRSGMDSCSSDDRICQISLRDGRCQRVPRSVRRSSGLEVTLTIWTNDRHGCDIEEQEGRVIPSKETLDDRSFIERWALHGVGSSVTPAESSVSAIPLGSVDASTQLGQCVDRRGNATDAKGYLRRQPSWMEHHQVHGVTAARLTRQRHHRLADQCDRRRRMSPRMS